MKRGKFSKYNTLFAIAITQLFISLIFLTLILEQKKLLIAPQLIASTSFDEKVRFFREVKPKQSQIVAVGSSVAVNNLDSTALKDKNGNQISFLNFGFYGLPISEAKSAIDLAVRVSGKPNTLLVTSAPIDFYGCFSATTTSPNTKLGLQKLNQTDAAQYIASNIPGVFYHAKYRGWWRMIDYKLMLEVQRQRTTNNTFDSLKFDPSGSVLLEIPKADVSPERWQGQQWGAAMRQLSSPQNTCYDDFQSLVDYTKQQNINLVFVLSPVRQGYFDKFDPARQGLEFHKQKITAILQKNNSIFIDAHSDLKVADEYFVDAVHLNKLGAQMLTNYVSNKLNKTNIF